jgi:hypothetical protein
MTSTQLTTQQIHTDAANATSPHTLAGEHALLWRGVALRAASVSALLDARVWPHDELGALTTFLRATVLRQVSDEEVLLYPRDATAPPFAELSTDHVRLRTLTARLERAHALPCPPVQLRALIGELLTSLRRHLLEEQAVLAALRDADTAVPSAADLAADLAAGRQQWLPDNDAPVCIELDALPREQTVQLCIERLLRLRPGQHAEIRSREKQTLAQVCRWMHDFDSVRYGIAAIQTGTKQSRTQVARRHSA